jgi:serine/threonine-protein kinase
VSFHVSEDIGDYRIISIIGAGSMGQVFQVEHRITKRKEAMKVLVGDCATESRVQRFEREIEVQARLDHPNIARVHNAVHSKNSLILVMELVEGESLEKKLQKGMVSRTAGLDCIRQTLSALGYAHERGVVHRDVTPGNLIVDQNGHVKLTDFGVAKSIGDYQLTNAGEVVGSLNYMPPEQVRSNSVPDPRSDIYSTGAVLYEILTGKKLFNLADRLSLMVAQVEQKPVAPLDIDATIGPKLNAVVLKSLAKDPAERYQSAREFLEALRPFGAESRRRRCFAPLPLGAVVLTAFALAFTCVAEFPPESPLPLPPKPAPIVGIGTLLQAPQSLSMAVAIPAPVVEERPKQRGAKSEPVAKEESETDTPTVEGSAAAAPAEETSAAENIPEVVDQEPADPQPKKGLWSRLNPFKKKKK